MDDSKEYLYSIKERMVAYDEVRLYTMEYIYELDIDNEELILTLLVMGFLWKSKQRGEELREDELNLLLGIEETEDFNLSDLDPTVTISLEDDQAGLTLDEILDQTVEEFNNLD